MPYSEKDHDRALSRLMADLESHEPPAHPRTEAGVGFALALLCFILTLWLLLAVGCCTIQEAPTDEIAPSLTMIDRN